MVKEVAIVYPVAGLSSRFGGVKQFAKIGPNGESLIEYSLNQALSAGFSKVIFIVGKLTGDLFKEKFGEEYKGVPIYYVLQEFDEERRERPWGTADAVCCIRGVIDCPFVFCNGDDIYGSKTFEKLFEHLQESDECATIGYELKDAIPEKGSVHRAIFDIDERNYVKKLEEVFNIKMNELDEKGLKEEDLSSMNIFALHPEVIEMLYSELLTFKLNNLGDKKIEFLIPTELSRLVESKRIKMKIYSTPDKWFGVTNPEDEGIVREMLKKEEEV